MQTTAELLDRVRQAFGNPAPPRQIWQEAFDYDPAHLYRLAQLRSDENAAPVDLVNYCLDFQYEEVQPDLFRHVFPFCLKAWLQDLQGEADNYGVFVAHLYPALVDGKIFDRVLSATETAAVAEFLRGGIIEEIDRQRGLHYVGSRAVPYRWISTLATYGAILPDIALLWRAWWRADTTGRAVAVVQYVSCLAYGATDNPVFPPWTPAEGGGPPALWEGELWNPWLEPNVALLERELTVEALRAALDRAVEQLAGQPELAVALRVRNDFEDRGELVLGRCGELVEHLRQGQAPPSTSELVRGCLSASAWIITETLRSCLRRHR